MEPIREADIAAFAKGGAQMANAVIRQPFTLYMTVALIYLAMTTVITIAVARLEIYANRHLRGGK